MKLAEDLEPLRALDRAATVVVYSMIQRDALRARILETIGAELASQTTIVIVSNGDRAMAHLSGRKGPIYIAAEFYTVASSFLIDLVESYAGRANRLPRETKLEKSTRD